jgi:hypothetical protein
MWRWKTNRAWSTKVPHLNVCAAVNTAVAIRTRALAHTTVTDEQPHSLCITRSVHQKVCGSDSRLAVPTVASHDSCFGLAYNDLGTYMYDLASRYEAYVPLRSGNMTCVRRTCVAYICGLFVYFQNKCSFHFHVCKVCAVSPLAPRQ